MTAENDTPEEEWTAVGVLIGGAMLWLALVWAVGEGGMTLLFWLSLVPIVLGALGFAAVLFVQQMRDDGGVPGRFARAMVCIAFAFTYLFAALLLIPSLRIG